jgi:uncharacterized protein YbjT (DUF2867 family)
MNRVLVIGSTGNIGRQVSAHLHAAGVPVRALARNPDTADLPSGIQVVRGDLSLPDTLDASLDGVDAVFLVWTAPPDTVATVVERIAKRARRIVFLSSPYKPRHPLFQASQPNRVAAMHAEIESLIAVSGIRWTFLRPGMLAANAVPWWGAQIRAGDVVRWPFPAAPTAPIDEQDIAAVAVHALCEDGHACAEYVLTGPESLTQAEQVATIGRVIGRPLRMEEMSPDEARREWLPTWPPPIVNMLLASWAAAVGQPALVTSTVAEITGTPARSFQDWAADHAAEFA